MANEVSQLKDLLIDVLEDVGGCTDASAELALSRTSREFLRKTEIWKEKLSINIVADQQEYTLTPSSGGIVQRITGVKVKNESSTTDFEKLNSLSEDYYTFEDPRTFKFDINHIPTYSKSGGMQIEIVITPRYNSPELPEWVIERYAEGLAAGAKARLMSSRNKPYYDPSEAARNQSLYHGAVTMALNEKRRNRKTAIKGFSA